MRRLLELLRAHLHWVLLVVCEAIALLLLFHGSLYHSFVGAATHSSIVGRIHTEGARWRTYLSLQQQNQALLDQLARLESRYLSLLRKQEYMLADTISPQPFVVTDTMGQYDEASFTFVTARVVSLSYLKTDNMMIIDRGSSEGIKANMGVVSPKGVVGIIATVGQDYATVVPLINESLSLSCMTLREGYVGDLSWRQSLSSSEGIVRGIPKQAHIAVGDTLVTSGYSAIFPAGLMIGRLMGEGSEGTPIPYRKELPVLLETDFRQLHYVYVITSGYTVALEEESLERG